MAQNNKGGERRRQPRRVTGDRRDAVRWEPAKGDRRRGHGRRATDGLRQPR